MIIPKYTELTFISCRFKWAYSYGKRYSPM